MQLHFDVSMFATKQNIQMCGLRQCVVGRKDLGRQGKGRREAKSERAHLNSRNKQKMSVDKRKKSP